MTSPAQIPVGTIVCYAADPIKFLPANWHVCDGTSMAQSSYPDLFAAIGTSNGGEGDMFDLPNLQGRFIRGTNQATSSSSMPTLTPGQVSAWQVGAPNTNITVGVTQMATDYHNTLLGVQVDMISWNEDATTFNTSNGDSETRPVNIYLYYVIKVLPSGNEGKTDDVPVGGVIPFGGSDNSYPPKFPSYIRCDGSKIDTSKVPALAKTVGIKYAPQNTPPTTFVAPDVTGKFIRGVDPNGTIDPDAGKRKEAPDGSASGPGTWQLAGTRFHNPTVSISHYSNSGHDSTVTAGHDNIYNADTSSSQDWKGGDDETRPINAAVDFYINSVDPTAAVQIFPVGGIIAVPGPAATVNEGTWLPCDGRTCVKQVYSALYSVIGFTWGKPTSDPNSFNVPSLAGYFLRAADTTGVANGDPDWNKRYNLLSGGNTRGPGSYQKSGTARPVTELTIPSLSYPTGEHENAATGGPATHESAEASGPQTFTLSDQWDSETAPTNIAVNFYIRAM